MSNPQIEQLLAKARAGKPDAQFLLSQIRRQEGDMEDMLLWLQKACANELPDALGAMGQCYEKGQGVAVDMAVAMQHYDRAAEAGSDLAAFQKAQLLYKSRHGSQHAEQIRELLVAAAAADVVPALRVLAYLASQQVSGHVLAIDCLQRSAALGDPVSAFMLGWCLSQGASEQTAAGEAVHWLQLAARAQFPFAANLLASLGNQQPVAPAPPANSRIDFERPFPLFPAARDIEREVFSEDPPITLFRQVLDIVDCAYLIFLSTPYLKRAHVIDPDGNKSGMVSKVRTSMSTYIPFEIVDFIGRYIELKIVVETGEDLLSSEPMSILRYAPGEYYRPHFDYFNPRLNVSDELLEDGGQRTASAVTYLSVPTAGGGTSFPKLNITVPPLAGGTLWFRNCLNDGQVDERSLHAGDTVIDGEKWVVTKWFRERPTQYLQI